MSLIGLVSLSISDAIPSGTRKLEQHSIHFVRLRPDQTVRTISNDVELGLRNERRHSRGADRRQLAEVEAAVPRGAVASSQYPTMHMAALDSEKR